MTTAKETAYLILPDTPYRTRLTAAAKREIDGHLEASYPEEGCGFFFGTEEGEVRTITATMPVQNTRQTNKERRFLIAPADYLAAERYATDSSLVLLGIYHSHPEHPAMPSLHDLRSALPWFSYIIESVRKGKVAEIRSWRLDEQNNRFINETIELKN